MKKFSLIIFASLLLAACSDADKIKFLGGDPVNLPPDPGIAGKQTLAGIDSNNNGVRDDLERAIYFKYPKDKQKRQLLYQAAKAAQFEIEVGGEKEVNQIKIYHAWDKGFALLRCKSIILQETDENYDYVKDFEIFVNNLAINTLERYKARERLNKASDGRVFIDNSNDKTACDNLGD